MIVGGLDTVMIGKTLNHYTVLEKLGVGGMGEVYLAEDTKLDRKVALKILPPLLASDPDLRARFEREAKAVAALNHPNIVTLYSVEEAGSIHFTTMELVSGKTLSELLPKGGVSLGQLLEYGIPLAEAVSAAHRKGITHRDLKPANVMVDDEGRLKVLDFGLAKLSKESSSEENATRMTTAAITQEGKILGTVAYMSPEQAEGKPVDPRSDVFSLGIMLYEMAAGVRPFQGENPISTITSILRDTPASVTQINQTLPRHVGRIIKRCLAKDPDRRYQTALELRNELEELQAEMASGELDVVPELTRARAGLRLRTAVALLIPLALLLVAAAYLAYNAGRGAGTPTNLLTGAFVQITDQAGVESYPSISPDGKTVAYASQAGGNWDVFVQRVGGKNAVNLTADSPGLDTQPAFSPDGESIAFRSDRQGGGIFIMGATGEFARRLTDFGYHPAWSPDGTKLTFSTENFLNPTGRNTVSQIWIVDVESGEMEKIEDGDAIQPSWSPNGHRIAYWALPIESAQRDLWTIPAGGGEAVPVTQDAAVDWNPVWSPDGVHLYFTSDRGGPMNLWRVRMDEKSGEVLGEPEPVTAGVSGASEYLSISADGSRLAYRSSTANQNMQRASFDASSGALLGEPVWVTDSSTPVSFCSPSPDGEWLVCATAGGQEDLFVIRPDGTGRRQLTDDPFKDRWASWSPDGRRIGFYSDRSGSYEIWTFDWESGELTQLTDTPDRSVLFPIWSPDGSRMIYQNIHQGEAFLFDPNRPWADQTPEPLPPVGEEDEFFTYWDWSSDGRLTGWLRTRDGQSRGIGIYSLETGELQRWDVAGGFPAPVWAGENVLFVEFTKLRLLDVGSGEIADVLSIAPDTVGAPAVSADGRSVYFLRSHAEADIWLLNLAPPGS